MKLVAASVLLSIFAMPAFFTLAADSPQPPAPTLQKLRGKSRVMLVSAPASAKAKQDEQRAFWTAEASGARERDLVLLELGADAESTATRKRLKIPPDRFTVLLIGKDGGEKARSAVPVKPGAWFGLIDGMPMRKSEVRAQKR